MARRELKRLRHDLRHVVSLLEEGEERPPLHPAELAVIAAVCWCDGPQTQGDLFRSILKHVKYFRRKALSEGPRGSWPAGLDFAGMDDTNDSDSDAAFSEIDVDVSAFEPTLDFLEAFDEYNISFTAVEGEQELVVSHRPYTCPRQIVVQPLPARTFLSHLLTVGWTREGEFPFLRLPSHIRNTIYEMLFTLPEEGVAVKEQRTGGLLNCGLTYHAARRREDKFKFRMTRIFDDCDVSTLPLTREMLYADVLYVNSQIRAEALPLLYSINPFSLYGIRTTITFLGSLPQVHLRHIREFTIDLTNIKRAKDLLPGLPIALRSFTNVCALERLKIVIYDKDWIDMPKQRRRVLGRKAPVEKYEDVPIFPVLAKLCAKVAAFEFVETCYGENVEVKAYLKGEVRKIKRQEKKARAEAAGMAVDVVGKKARKRKAKMRAEGSGEEGSQQRAKKVRVSEATSTAWNERCTKPLVEWHWISGSASTMRR